MRDETWTFRLSIRLGNDAMSGPDDVAQALRRVADRLERAGWGTMPSVRDENGNSVGRWDLEHGEEEGETDG